MQGFPGCCFSRCMGLQVIAVCDAWGQCYRQLWWLLLGCSACRAAASSTLPAAQRCAQVVQAVTLLDAWGCRLLPFLMHEVTSACGRLLPFLMHGVIVTVRYGGSKGVQCVRPIPAACACCSSTVLHCSYATGLAELITGVCPVTPDLISCIGLGWWHYGWVLLLFKLRA